MIHRETHGNGGPVLLLSHGFGYTCRMWDPNVRALAEHHRVVTWDMRGHGRSTDEDCTHERTIVDMAALLDEAGARRAVVGGQSLGGYLSLRFRLEHPDRVSALVLVATGPGFRSDGPRDVWNAFAEDLAQRIERDGPAPAGVGDPTHTSWDGLAAAARGILVQHDARVIDSLTDIDVPVLIVVGERDERFLGAADHMARRIPNATKVVIADAGHAVNIDQPGAFNRAVGAFLEALHG